MSYLQQAFSGGEWSQAAQGQSSHPEYRTAMNVCLNGLPADTRAWVRRPGSRRGGYTRGGAAGKLLRFDFQESAPYNLEFTDGFLRFWKGINPATTNDQRAVSSVSTANPAVVTTTLANPWITGNAVRFSNLGAVSPLMQNREFKITVLSPTTFSLTDALTGAAVDGATLAWVAATPAIVKRTFELPTPYVSQAWSNLRRVQTEKQAVLLTGIITPYILRQTVPPGVSTDPTFTLTASQFLDGPYLDPYPGSIATPSAKTGNITFSLGFAAYVATKSYSLDEYVLYGGIGYRSLISGNVGHQPDIATSFWVSINAGDPIGANGFVASDVGRHIRMFSEPDLWVAATSYSTGNIVTYNGTYWISLVNTNAGNVPGNDPTKWGISANATLWTWGRITSLPGSGLIAQATGTAIGTLVTGGGLASCFDSVFPKAVAASAQSLSAAASSTTVSVSAYIGKDYSAAAKTAGTVTIYPPIGNGFCYSVSGAAGAVQIVLNYRASHTLPTSSSDGTLLGTTGAFTDVPGTPRSIASNDHATSWEYQWVEIIVTDVGAVSGSTTIRAIASQVFFFSNASNGDQATVQIAGPDLLYTTSIKTWRLGAYSDTTGWPKCGTYHDGRLWLSGAIGNRIDASKSNDIFNFAPTAQDGTVAASNGISYTFNAPDVNAIFWMEPDQQGIVCGTQAGEWLVQQAATTSGLSPLNIKANRVTLIKCANVEPARTDHTTVFVQKNGSRLMEYFADIYSGKFAAPNISIEAKHLTALGIAQLAYQQDDIPVVWVRSNANALIGVTYKRDSLISKDGPTIQGWHRHTLGSGFTVESIVAGPSVDGTKDALAMITKDATSGYRQVEVLGAVFNETNVITDANFVDNTVVPSYWVTSDTGVTFYGLYPLNGKTVTVFAGGLDCGDVAVSNGSCVVAFGDGVASGTGSGLFTRAFVDGYSGTMPVLIGSTYTSDGQMLRAIAPAEAGTRQGPALGNVRRAQEFAAQLVVTKGVSFGTDFAKMRTAYFKTKGGTNYGPLQLFSGILQDKLDDDYSFDTMMAWRITRPYPAIIAAVQVFPKTSER